MESIIITSIIISLLLCLYWRLRIKTKDTSVDVWQAKASFRFAGKQHIGTVIGQNSNYVAMIRTSPRGFCHRVYRKKRDISFVS